MPSANFLLVDDVVENRYLISRTLIRKFPDAIIQECDTIDSTLQAMKSAPFTAIIVHRTIELDGPEVIARLRALDRAVPIVMISGRESCPEGIEAGASAFLNYDAWLRIATVVEELLSGRYVKALTASPFQPSEESRRWTH